MNRSKWSSAGYSAEWMEGRLEPLFPSPPDRTDESAVQAIQALFRLARTASDPVIEFKRISGLELFRSSRCWPAYVPL